MKRVRFLAGFAGPFAERVRALFTTRKPDVQQASARGGGGRGASLTVVRGDGGAVIREFSVGVPKLKVEQ
jgi:hypothetical protein